MQMVKNVLLYREKTLARKLQELFLTWHVENTLDKDRIFEIYLNVIEFGPSLYGIGPAAHHYFGKPREGSQPGRGRVLLVDPAGPQGALRRSTARTRSPSGPTGKIERHPRRSCSSASS